jgi:hypothetical protein
LTQNSGLVPADEKMLAVENAIPGGPPSAKLASVAKIGNRSEEQARPPQDAACALLTSAVEIFRRRAAPKTANHQNLRSQN